MIIAQHIRLPKEPEWHPLHLMFKDPIEDIYAKKLPAYSYSGLPKNSQLFPWTIKDKILVFLRSGIVCKFKCNGCNATSYAKTKHNFKVRICEHREIFALAGRRIKGNSNSAINEHPFFCNYPPGFHDFFMLPGYNNEFNITLMESLLINRNQPLLNKNKLSLSLELFDD